MLQIMFSGRHISVNWTIMGRSSLCYLMNGLKLIKGRRLGSQSRFLGSLNHSEVITAPLPLLHPIPYRKERG